MFPWKQMMDCLVILVEVWPFPEAWDGMVAATELYFMISCFLIKLNCKAETGKLSTRQSNSHQRKLTKHFQWREGFHSTFLGSRESRTEDDKSSEKLKSRRRSQPRYNLLFDPDSSGGGQQKAGNYICVVWGEVRWGDNVRWLSCSGVVSLMPWLGLVSRRALCLIIDGPWLAWRATGERRVAVAVLVVAS